MSESEFHPTSYRLIRPDGTVLWAVLVAPMLGIPYPPVTYAPGGMDYYAPPWWFQQQQVGGEWFTLSWCYEEGDIRSTPQPPPWPVSVDALPQTDEAIK